jgi:hypothetical protein
VTPGAISSLASGPCDEDFLAWADIGISGYLGPDSSAHDLLSAARRIGVGEVACPPRLTTLLLSGMAVRSGERSTRSNIFALAAREREIAELLADGLSNKLIARRLQVALPTVKTMFTVSWINGMSAAEVKLQPAIVKRCRRPFCQMPESSPQHGPAKFLRRVVPLCAMACRYPPRVERPEQYGEDQN